MDGLSISCSMDWDLEAIVRGCTAEAPAATIVDGPYPNFSHLCSEKDDLLCSFPEFSETTRVLDELGELYKPFYPVLHPLASQTIVTSSLPVPQESEEVKVPKTSQKVALQDLQVPAASKCKTSKKKQNKRMVKQVTAVDGVCDAWAWRKYGQKPIKGSPYPRSYYKCSTSRGCLARKQVERSHLDPNVFLVTYTAEHSHPHPTRRNSLAGCTRHNYSSIITPSINTICSSRTPLKMEQSNIEIEDELLPNVQVQQQSKGSKEEQDFLE